MTRIIPNSPSTTAQQATSRTPRAAGSFQNTLAEVRFSKHALQRVGARGLSQQEQHALAQAVDKARRDGSRESLILMGDLALVVNVQHGTVITAFDESRLRQTVVTHIDSAVIVKPE